MRWIYFLWPIAAGVGVTVALVHLLSGIPGAARNVQMISAFLALLKANYSIVEMSLVRDERPDEYLAWQRWEEIVSAAVPLSYCCVFDAVWASEASP